VIVQRQHRRRVEIGVPHAQRFEDALADLLLVARPSDHPGQVAEQHVSPVEVLGLRPEFSDGLEMTHPVHQFYAREFRLSQPCQVVAGNARTMAQEVTQRHMLAGHGVLQLEIWQVGPDRLAPGERALVNQRPDQERN